MYAYIWKINITVYLTLIVQKSGILYISVLQILSISDSVSLLGRDSKWRQISVIGK